MRLLIAVFLVRVQDEEFKGHPDFRMAFIFNFQKSLEFHDVKLVELI